MNPQDLITPKVLFMQLMLLLGFLMYSMFFGPPQPQRPHLGFKEIVLKSDQEQSVQLPNIDQELLISERRPGSLKHRGKNFFEKKGRIWGHLENQWIALLTLDPQLQKITKRHFENSHAALGALAMMEVNTGRVIGLSEYINHNHVVTRRLKIKNDVHLALRALAPAAGLFRIVSTAALLNIGIKPYQRFCYTKFKYTLRKKHLDNNDPNACSNLNEAFAKTDNSFLAYVTHRHLKTEDLKRMALNLGFDRKISYFGLPYELSTAYIVRSSNLRRAETALGLRNSKANTLHGAMIASAIATDGTLVRPRIVDQILSDDGKTVPTPQLEPIAQGISPLSAGRLRKMMKNSINEGQTRKVFQNWPSSLRNMRVAGQESVKTYTTPHFVRYTWFIGFTPIKKPKWAISVMVINDEEWYVRALDIAHRVLKEYLEIIQE